MMTPDVSILIPVYNEEVYLPRCLDSIVRQTLQSWELLLVDDGSTDRSGSICDSYAARDSRIRVIHQENAGISGILDATPFLVYFIENVYHKLNGALPAVQTTAAFQAALSQGQITEKEKSLWEFVLSAYGDAEFSTKQLEKDFGNAAYATIRSFVLKFEKLGLLQSARYGNRVKYAVRMS